jgi:3-hydroxyisobutyrate dehydrogenase-like beta-hydroxyacid dehydrogenase
MRETGLTPVGFDLDDRRASSRGLPAAASLAELVEQVDLLLLSLPDSRAVEAVIRGDGGVLRSCRAGQTIVDLSTAAPSSTVALAAELAERGVRMLDAGVSGGAAAAENGTLTLMVGGDQAVLDQVRPVLERFSAKIFFMGGPGAGHVMKLLNNFLNGISLAATAEVMVAARIAGLDLHKVLDVINASSGVNFATMQRFPHIVDGDYLEGGLTSRLMMKDITLYVDMVCELGAPSINAAGPLASFGLAIGQGYGDEISNRVVDAIGDLAGGVRLHGSAE